MLMDFDSFDREQERLKKEQEALEQQQAQQNEQQQAQVQAQAQTQTQDQAQVTQYVAAQIDSKSQPQSSVETAKEQAVAPNVTSQNTANQGINNSQATPLAQERTEVSESQSVQGVVKSQEVNPSEVHKDQANINQPNKVTQANQEKGLANESPEVQYINAKEQLYKTLAHAQFRNFNDQPSSYNSVYELHNQVYASDVALAYAFAMRAQETSESKELQDGLLFRLMKYVESGNGRGVQRMAKAEFEYMIKAAFLTA